MPDQIEDQVKEARRDELMELQQAIAFEKAEGMIGQELEVVVEGRMTDEDVYVTRTLAAMTMPLSAATRRKPLMMNSLLMMTITIQAGIRPRCGRRSSAARSAARRRGL